MPADPHSLAVAWQCYQSGDFAQAEQVYRNILATDPAHAAVWCGLGVACRAQRKLSDALSSLRQALALDPNLWEAHNSLGNVLLNQGRIDEAVACYRDALRLRPDDAQTHNNLRIALEQQASLATLPALLDRAVRHHQAGQLPQAEPLYRQILQINPRHVDAVHLLGLIAHQVGKNDVAVHYIGDAVRLKPDFAEAHNNLGLAFKAQGKFADAVSRFEEATRLKPDYAEAHGNLANALREQGRLAEAVTSYRQAVRHKPNHAEAHNSLAIALAEQGDLEEAAAHFEEALRLNPGHAEAHNNLGLVRENQGKLEAALDCYRAALRLKPDFAEAHDCLGMALLLRGDFEHGWSEYQWRWRVKDFAGPRFRQPLWDGSPLDGKTILLYPEQGLGDAIQFIRYAPLVQARGGKVFLACPAALADLLASCPGLDRVFPQGSGLPSFDVQAPLLSLPGMLGTTLATVPAQVPYLFADAVQTRRWQHDLRALAGLKIGIAWQGNPEHRRDRYRSCRLVHFAPLARLEGVQLLSLQKGPGTEQLGADAGRVPVIDLRRRMPEALGAITDTAAVLMNLDLVVTVDTAIAHLAGALGRPVWVALPYVPDWRWLLDREDSPWYPTMRLFRQTEAGNWEAVFAGMARELAKLVDSNRGPTV